MRPIVTLFFTFTIFLFTARAIAMEPEPNLRTLAVAAASEDEAAAKQARALLREAGPAGLEALRAQFAPEIAKAVDGRLAADDAAWKRIRDALDAIAAQRDDYASGLFWYTDIDLAKAAARAAGKPILSLRLLGTLDSEMSCANSRFFRTTLYANEKVSSYLQKHFILHWKSVRPVPKVTIDMGDGRVVHRTITGNSIHYVLDANGRPIDAIPGLYGPEAFLRAVSAAEIAEQSLHGLKDDQRAIRLAEWHQNCIAVCDAAWGDDLRALGVNVAMPDPAVALAQAAAPRADAAARRAIGKTAVERRIVNEVVGVPPVQQPDLAAAATTSEFWVRIAARHADDVKLDEGSRRLMRSKFPAARAAGLRAESKRRVEDPLVRTIANFERSVAEDTVRNEYTLHRTIHLWFARQAAETRDVDALNKRVYAELFLTPDSDPWLGLVPADTYTALQDDGMTEECLK